MPAVAGEPVHHGGTVLGMASATAELERGRSAAPPPPRRGLRHSLALAAHLSRREAAQANRWTLLGWMWPLVRQLVQLAVLVFAFSAVFDLDIPNYPVFVFCGLVGWSWFAGGLSAASGALLARRHLVLQPGFPTAVLPLVAITVPLIDVLVALPVLAAMLLATTGLKATALLLPILLLIQAIFMAGVAWAAAAASVFVRDVPNLVSVVIGVLFYLTPVFYPLARVPEEYRDLLSYNPIGVLLEGWRDLVIEGRIPPVGPLAEVLAVAVVAAVAGYLLFRRLAGGFAEEV